MSITMNFKTATGIILSLFLVLTTTSVVFGEAAAAGAAGQSKEEKCPKTVKVLAEQVKGDTFPEYRDFKAAIQPWKSQELKSPLAGSIKVIERGVGSDVNAGDAVAVIDDTPIKKEIAGAKANARNWQRVLHKREGWRVRSQRAEEQAKRNIKRYTGLLAQKEEELERVRILSPADGRIDVLKINEGDFISKDFVLGTIVTIDKVRIPLHTYGDKVTDGQRVTVSIDELSGTVPGIVEKDPDGSTYIYIENSGKRILNGMTARFRLLFETHKNAVVLPREKIMADETGNFVYVVNGKYARKAALKTGPEEKGRVLILEGLSIGDQIIVSEILSAKQATLKDGLDCVNDNKKIKIMAMDNAKGKYIARKKGMPAVPVTAPVPKPVKVKPAELPKPAKVEAKETKEVKKTRPARKRAKPVDYPKVEAFIAYLESNRNTLGYEKFKKYEEKDAVQVAVYCSAAVRDRLMPVIHKFDVEKYCVVKLVPDRYKVSTFFGTAARTRTRTRTSKHEREILFKRFRVGASLDYYMMTDSNFKEVYGSMTGFGIDISYMFTENLDIWFHAGTSSKTAAIDWAEEDLKFKFTPLTLDVRYFFTRMPRWDFFAGAGLNIYPFTDTNPIEDVKSSAMGFNIMAGTYYHLTETFSLQFALRYNLVKKEIENADNDLNMNSLEALFGITVNF